jgi:proton-translocating NAD(P)+ transhydrogenase subunit beta
MRDTVVALAYLAASALFILGLKGISQPKTARRGLRFAEVGMLLAIIGTLVKAEIVDFRWIAIAMVVGAAVGTAMSWTIPMTAMPQRIALSHAFGALAAGLVGTAEFYDRQDQLSRFTMVAIVVECLLGFLTFTGSLIAFGKLSGTLPSRPWIYRAQNFVNLGILAVALGIGVWLVIDPGRVQIFPVLIALSLVFGAFLVVRIGGADMPTVISLMNSYAGLSAAAMGFVLNNPLLIIAGALDGSSGFILSVIMCRAMNRSFTNVLFGGFGAVEQSVAAGVVEDRPVRSATSEEAAMLLETARDVIIVPGYGLAVAQAQHKIRELGDLLARNGCQVRFAIHPVAGRMPGHMNVLLAEADISYDRIFDMDHINSDFGQCDVALVVGANDVTNPAAKTNKGSPIYGMPVLDVASARTVMVVKRSMNPGFSGVENELYFQDKTLMLFGDAKQVVDGLVRELESLVPA